MQAEKDEVFLTRLQSELGPTTLSFYMDRRYAEAASLYERSIGLRKAVSTEPRGDGGVPEARDRAVGFQLTG